MEMPFVRGIIRARPLTATVALSIFGYGAVLGVFLSPQFADLFPELTRQQVEFLTHAIALVNSTTIITLALGWYWIRSGEVRKHAAAMSTSFVLILLFLGMYLPRVAGGGTKYFVGPDPVYSAYLVLLGIHIVLSILAVPVVLYAIVLGISHTEQELRTETPHRRVGRLAAGSWLLSLILGVVTYLLLNHLYESEYEAAQAAIVVFF